MSLSRRRVALGACVTVTAALVAGPAALAGAVSTPPAPAVVTLAHEVLPTLATLTSTGATSPSQVIDVGLSVAGRDPAGLFQFNQALFNKTSPSYLHYLSAPQWAAQFGVEPARQQAISSWLTNGGLAVESQGNGTYVLARGTVGQVEKLFNVAINNYTDAVGPFYANANAPAVPSGFGIQAVVGLESETRLTLPNVKATPRPAGTSVAVSPTSPNATAPNPFSTSTNPSDLWSIYDQPAANQGQGETLAAIGEGVSNASGTPDGIESDLRLFETSNHLPWMPYREVQVGAAGTDTGGAGEWRLDSQAASGMAPMASQFTFYFATALNTADMAGATAVWASDPAGARQASQSWGGCEILQAGDTGAYAMDQILQQAADEGRSMFVSSGDSGGGCFTPVNGANSAVIGVEFPSSSPFAISVGGTVITADGNTPPKRSLEYAWTASGGGTSVQEVQGPWQTEAQSLGAVTIPGGDPTGVTSGTVNAGITYCAADDRGYVPFSSTGQAYPCRTVPDVAAQSGDLTSGYNIYLNGAPATYLGTSLSAPLWQGMWSRVNAASTNATTGAGFASPLVYSIGLDPKKYAASFTDITTGDNGPYPATPGYDRVTGWGVPDVTGLATTVDGSVTPTHPGSYAPAYSGSGGGTGGTGGTGGGGPTSCGAAPQLTHTSFTAPGGIVALDGTPVPEPVDALNLKDGGLAWDGTNLIATVDVASLSTAPAGALGEVYRYNFTIGSTQYELQAQRTTTPSTGTPSFTLTYLPAGATGYSAVGGPLAGSFNESTNTVTIVLPAAMFNATAPGASTPLKSGAELKALLIEAQRSEDLVTLTNSTATTPMTCSFLIP